MHKVILISNKLFDYRVRVYEEFYELFLSRGIIFKVYVTSFGGIEYNNTSGLDIQKIEESFRVVSDVLIKEKPDAVINFLHPTNKMMWLLYGYTLLHRIPNVYWNHGINLQDPHNLLKNIIYRFIHRISSAIILYSENELKHISKGNWSKTFIANNTISFSRIPDVQESKEALKKEFGIAYDKIVLFVGRIQKRKRLDVLLKIFEDEIFSDYGLVIVGGGLEETDKVLIDGMHNVIRLGPVYDEKKINQLFKLSDVFCIPGTNGLGINQAMYWGLPCMALNVKHSPEICYLKNGINGYLVEDEAALKDKLLTVLKDDKLLAQLSASAASSIRQSASIEKMIGGFLNAIDVVRKGKCEMS